MGEDKRNSRAAQRTKLAIDLEEHLIASADRHPIRALAVDVSRNGLGIVCFENLPVDSETILLLKEKGIAMKVVWCQADSVRQDIYHVGLSTNDLAVNVATLLERAGLAKRESQTSPSPSANQATPANAPDLITFDPIRAALAIAHTPDPGALRGGSLAELANIYHAYPINYRGKSLYVLLPRDLRPLVASKLEESEAIARKIMILRMEHGILKKLWPPKATAVHPAGGEGSP